MLQVAFAGTFPASLEEPVRRHLTTQCEIIVADESAVVSRLADIDVLVTMALTAEMGRASSRLKLFRSPVLVLIGSIGRHYPRGPRLRTFTVTKPAYPST